jgi:sugar lactone lactonase YvrE
MEVLMKTQVLFIAALVLIAVLAFTGCEERASTTTMQLRFMTDRNTSGSTRDPVSPSGQGLAITGYTITGVGPNDNTFSLATSSAQVEINGLVIGSWTIHVEGLNQQGTKIAEGSVTHHLTTQENRVEVYLDDFEGSGSVRLGFFWGDTEFDEIAFDLKIKEQGAQAFETVTSGKTVDLATASATFESVLSTGSYELTYNLSSRGVSIGGGIVALRILDGMLSERDIPIVIDKPTPEATALSITSGVVEPVTGMITSIGSSILPNTPVTVAFEPTGGGGGFPLQIDWYLDGQWFAQGENAEFSTYTGSHRLDVIAQTEGIGSVGSETHPFRASVESMGGVPVTVDSITAGDTDINEQLYWTQGVTDTAFMRDGRLLIASTHGLQLCEVMQDKLIVVNNFSSNGLTHSDNPFPTEGITDLEVDTFDDIVCTTARDSGLIVFYQYDSEQASLTKITSCKSDGTNYQWGTTITNAGLDVVNNYVFLMDSTTNRLYYAPYSNQDVTPFRYAYVYISGGSLDAPKNLRVAAQGSQFVISCPDIGAFFTFNTALNLSSENALYIDFAHSYFESDPNLGGPYDAWFVDNNVIGAMQDGLHVYNGSTHLAKVAYQTDQVMTFASDGIPEEGWAVHAGESPAVYHMSFSGGAPIYSTEGMPTGQFIPDTIALSPAGNLLCIAGSNTLQLLRVSDI